MKNKLLQLIKPVVGTSPNSNAIKEYKAKLTELSQEQKEAAIGLILGDVSLNTQNKGNTYRLKFEWGDKHKEYVYHVHKLFDEWVLSDPRKVTRVNANGNTVITWQFQTLSHEVFNEIGNLFLNDENKKYVPKDLIKDHLTPRGLAYWFMDDGGKLDYSHGSKGIVFNTHSFTKQDVDQMCLELSSKYDLDCWVKLNKNKPIIAISSKSGEKILSLIEPYIIPGMRYKLPGNKS